MKIYVEITISREKDTKEVKQVSKVSFFSCLNRYMSFMEQTHCNFDGSKRKVTAPAMNSDEKQGSRRASMQDYRAFPLYLSQEIWDVLADRRVTQFLKTATETARF